ncbi:hypothetical protein H0H81_004139 [Sphagnurus paluster]|uniref:Nucleoporin NDC1 n=1 Tax=Sphagnurus paluster TaxID=117069 RepID=A0A9P7FS54_9AGAR|nr:hypothetical protein H0H81_004139 [Sphagnurus paluster]
MSSSLSRSTPVRAITTTLSTRSAPSIPPPTTTYEPVVKSLLRSRFVHIFLYSSLFSWTFTTSWTIWSLGGASDLGLYRTIVVPFLPLTLLNTILVLSTAAIPAAVLRKAYLTPTRTSATSLSALVKASLSKPATHRSLMVYALSALSAIAIHATILYASGMSHGLNIFVKKHPYYLNGRLLFALLSQLSVAAAFSLRNVTLDRFVFRWAAIQSSKTQRKRFNWGDILQAFVIAAVIATLTVPFAAITFGLLRLAFPMLYKLPLLPTLLRPFTAHFLRGSWTLVLPFRHISLLTRAWFLAFSTLATWEFSNALFDTIIYQPITASELTAEPHLTLVSGISSADTGFRYLAYTELATLAADESAAAAVRRSALFNDQKYNPGLWAHLVRESLLFLGTDYQHFLRRGKPAPAPVSKSTPVVPTTPAKPLPATPTPLIRTSIFQSNKASASPVRTVVEGLGSDGVFAQALDAGAEAAHIPALFRSVEAAVLPAPTVREEVQKKAEEKASGLVQRVKGEVLGAIGRALPAGLATFSKGVQSWWTRERMERAAQTCLPNIEMDVVIAEVLSHLICASLTEDKYGVVQRDIPRVLEALLSFLSAVEEYHTELRAKYTPPAIDQEYSAAQIAEFEEKRAEVERAGEVLCIITDGLKGGVARIVRTFGDKLLAFKFPPRTAQKLQPFLEYC